MTMHMTSYKATHHRWRDHRGRFRAALSVATLALLLAGCKDSFLSVTDADNIDPSSLSDEAGLQARRNGAWATSYLPTRVATTTTPRS